MPPRPITTTTIVITKVIQMCCIQKHETEQENEITIEQRIYKPEHNNPSRPYEQSGGHPNRKP